ncbi:MAG: helix-turn-helix domain-containing protein [Allorhizobium sp.]
MQHSPKPKMPKPDDVTIGANIRSLRQRRGLSQERLGEALGITFQQVQKYEKGTNRVSGSKLVAVANALAVPLEALFAGTGSEVTDGLPMPQLPVFSNQGRRLVEAFERIEDPVQRRSLLLLVEALGGSPVVMSIGDLSATTSAAIADMAARGARHEQSG